MRARLMFDDHDFDPEHDERPGEAELIGDLDLTTLWAAAAAGDKIIHASIRTATLTSLLDTAQISYRGQTLADCLAQPGVVRELYTLAGQAIAAEREIYRASFLRRSSEALLNRSVTALRSFTTVLQRLRELAQAHASAFTSPAFSRFFATVDAELDADYFAEIDQHLRTLRFRDGLVASAHLGQHNQGVDYVLRVPRTENQNRLLPRHPPVKRPSYSRTLPRDDDGAHQDLAGLRDRVLSVAADDLAAAADHILRFFTALRSELAFYVGCLNLHEQLSARGLPMCRPEPHGLGSQTLAAVGLYDPCLGLRSPTPVQGNDLRADGRSLILVTGANQGGKSTFLRSVGLAHLMMAAGMPVAAESFTAATVAGVTTHYARAEDATMAAGKFDEELSRMSRIAGRIRPHALLLCNESFATTNEREAAEIASDILRALNQVGIRVVFVTHLYELAHRFEQQHDPTTLSLRAERDETGQRSFRLLPGSPEPTSYGQDLYWCTFVPEPGPGPHTTTRSQPPPAPILPRGK
ncbi:MAG: DNA mismatch repair protein [Mycobacteriaceae bacterium]